MASSTLTCWISESLRAGNGEKTTTPLQQWRYVQSIFLITNVNRKWNSDKECTSNMSSTKSKFQWVRRWGCVPCCCDGSRKIYCSFLRGKVGHFPSADGSDMEKDLVPEGEPWAAWCVNGSHSGQAPKPTWLPCSLMTDDYYFIFWNRHYWL